MAELVPFTTRDNQTIYVESAGARSGAVNVSRHNLPQQAQRQFSEIVEQISHIAESLASQVGKLDVRPSEVTVELGVGITGSADVFIAQASSEAALTVTLTWSPGDETAGTPNSPPQE
ncbi:CU044_2847 family protein [Salinactinospora qingdaonensis]|uniref:Trypsin-co-occurring domain-containing protein n=1 Tax=Salinactinospora qingdaonensis TaxID=702744 RepID=A0ABP7FPM3_9ACTN